MSQSEKEVRRAYVERFGQERVAWAASRASSHRLRSAKRGRAEHFTTWQLLDLCEAYGFRCCFCNQDAPLYLHHRRGLYQEGPNTIENIEPLCEECHGLLEGYPDDVTERWLRVQARLIEKFPVGSWVRILAARQNWAIPDGRLGIYKTWIGEVLELIPAERGARPLRGLLTQDGKLRALPFHSQSPFRDWQLLGARARVRWMRKVRGPARGLVEMRECMVCLRGVEAAPKRRSSEPPDSRAGI